MSLGRITTGYNGVLLGLESKDNKLIQNAVYDIVEEDGKLVLKHIGEYHYDFNKNYQGIETTILMQRENIVATKEEVEKIEDFRACRSEVPEVQNYQRIDSVIGLEFQEKIGKRNDILLEDKPEAYPGELIELTDILGSTIAVNFIYDRNHLAFLKFMKENKHLDFGYDYITDKEIEFYLEDFKEFVEGDKNDN